MSLLAALAVALSARPLAAAPRLDASVTLAAEDAAPVPTRIEGFVKSIEGNNWLVDQTPVVRGPRTTLIELRGKATVGAYVRVAGSLVGNRLEADMIEVLRRAGAPAPTYQFTGTLRKQGATAWKIEDTPIDVTSSTQIGPNVRLNGLVRVTVRRLDENRLEALAIQAIADDPASVPFAIEGTVEEVNDDSWVVDNEPIMMPPGQATAAGQGDTVEIKAVKDGSGSLVALETRLVDPAVDVRDGYVIEVNRSIDDSQTWSMMVFEGGRPERLTIHVPSETYVDEDRAVIKPNVEARVQVAKDGAPTVNADRVLLEQPVPAAAAGALTAGSPDELASVGNQPVWFESEELMRAAQVVSNSGTGPSAAGAAKTAASVAVRGLLLSSGVLIVKEVMTVEAAATDGLLADPNGAGGGDLTGLWAENWQGPIGIDASLSSASKPTVLFDVNGGAHAVYESSGKIYYAYQAPGDGWGSSRKIGTGSNPAAVFDSQGQLHVVYTSEFMGNYDILHVRLASGAWTLAHVVAPTTGKSDDPAIAAGANGKVYAAWMDFTSGEWAIQIGMWDGKYWTSYPVPNGRGQSPAATVMPDGPLVLAWQDRIPLGGNAWGKYDIFVSERLASNTSWSLPVNVSDNRTYRPSTDSLGPRLVASRDGFANVAWIDDTVQVRYDFGRGLYWPSPVDVTGKRPVARGLGMQISTSDQVYIAWDEGTRLRVTANSARAEHWPDAFSVATRASPANGSVFDVSLATGGDGLSVTWVQRNLSGNMGVYESRYNMQPVMLKYYLPWITAP